MRNDFAEALNIQAYQDHQTNTAADIAQQQANLDAAASQFAAAQQDSSSQQDSAPDPSPENTNPNMQPFIDSLMAKGYSLEEAVLEWQDLVNSSDPDRIKIVTLLLGGRSLDDAKSFADELMSQASMAQTVANALLIAWGWQAVQGALEYVLARAAATDSATSLWRGVANYLGRAAEGETGAAASEGAGAAANELGAAREKFVADQIRGQVPEAPLKVNTQYGPAQIDVVGPNGELIEVGGPGKALNPGRFGEQMQKLEAAAEATGTQAQFYYDQGTPESILQIARKWLGSENVIPFNSGQ